jgi:hypothetical protein
LPIANLRFSIGNWQLKISNAQGLPSSSFRALKQYLISVVTSFTRMPSCTISLQEMAVLVGVPLPKS